MSRALAILLALAALARADEPPVDAAHAEARRLSDLGADALARGEYAIALHDFESAYALFPSPRLHYNLALAHDGIGTQPAETTAELRAFLDQATDAPAEQRAWAERRIGELAPKIAHLAVTGAAGAAVTIDGRDAGRAPIADAPVDPGEHTIAQGGRSVTVHVTEGERQEIALRAPLGGTPESTPITHRWWFWTGVGVAVAAGVAVAVQIATTPHAPSSELGNFPVY